MPAEVRDHGEGTATTRLVLLGPPACGKGTLGRLLRDEFGLAYFSTGRQLRREVRADTALGREADRYLSRNEYVPDELVLRLVEEWLRGVEGGWVLDGFPRTLPQGRALDGFPEEVAGGLRALLLDVPEEVLERRVTHRRECRQCPWSGPVEEAGENGACPECGGNLVQRRDDTPEAFRKRMAVYEELTRPLVDHYGRTGRLLRVSGVGSPEEVFKEVRTALETHG